MTPKRHKIRRGTFVARPVKWRRATSPRLTLVIAQCDDVPDNSALVVDDAHHVRNAIRLASAAVTMVAVRRVYHRMESRRFERTNGQSFPLFTTGDPVTGISKPQANR
jgi:hypothetical protein